MKRVALVLAIIAAASLAGCATKKVYTKGKYIEPGEVILLSDKFVEADLQIIADRLSQSLLSSEAVASRKTKPAVIMSLITNGTDEHIDMLSLSNKIRQHLIESGQLRFINERMRKIIAAEYEYQASGYVSPETAKQKGLQIGADWLVSGHISAIKQPVGRKEIVYYKTTLEVTDLETSEILWSDELEIKKQFQRKRVTM
jgi:uncharacterized protein (TIGR02722 family)